MPDSVGSPVKTEFKEPGAGLKEAVKSQLLRMETLMVRQFRWPPSAGRNSTCTPAAVSVRTAAGLGSLQCRRKPLRHLSRARGPHTHGPFRHGICAPAGLRCGHRASAGISR